MLVVAIGDITTGFAVFGPFASPDEAIDWSLSNHGSDISVFEIQKPFGSVKERQCDA